MTFTGTLVREDIGTGAWVLETSDGERLTLAGDVPNGLAGRKVRVEGRKSGGTFGFAMLGGSVIEVSAVTPER